MKKTMTFFILIIFLTSCLSDPLVYETDENTKKIITEIELILIRLKFNSNNKELKNLFEVKIKSLKEKSKNNKYLEAKYFAFSAQYEFLNNNNIKMNKLLKDAEKKHSSEEFIYILKYEIEETKQEKEKILKNGIKKADSTNILKLYLADYYFENSNFKKAITLYDEVFTKFNPGFKKAYSNIRELAYKFNLNPPKDKSTAKILIKDKISYSDMLQVTIAETKLLSGVIDDTQASIYDIYNKLILIRYIYKDIKIPLIDDYITRKDIAYFLVNIIAFQENDPSILDRYKVDPSTMRYGNSDSIINDIKAYEYYYNAVLILVEMEIMELPDGENFYPDNTLSGVKFFEILNNLSSWYNKK